MKCPYCDAEMELGVIASSEPINWLKEKHFVNQPKESDGEFTPAKAKAFKRATVGAWLCGNCRKVIIEF